MCPETAIAAGHTNEKPRVCGAFGIACTKQLVLPRGLEPLF